MSGKQFDSQFGFPTPDGIPETLGCRLFDIPSDPVWFALLMGALYPLTQEKSWYKWGDMTPAEAAAAWMDIYDTASACDTPSGDVGTPFWDDVTDTDDEFAPEEQPWYGEVDDPTELPTSETFRETLEDWTFAGLLAIAGAPGAAIAFLTIAPKFRLAFKQGDVGGIIRVFVDSYKAGEIEQDGSGDLLEMDIIGNPENETHQVYITLGAS